MYVIIFINSLKLKCPLYSLKLDFKDGVKKKKKKLILKTYVKKIP